MGTNGNDVAVGFATTICKGFQNFEELLENPLPLPPKDEMVHEEDILGPDSKYIKVISAEDEVFYMFRPLALMSRTLCYMLSGPGEFGKDQPAVIHLHYSSKTVKRLISLFRKKYAYVLKLKMNPPHYNIHPNEATELIEAFDFLGF